MKKRMLAAGLGLAISAAVLSAAVYSYAQEQDKEEIRLQIAGEDEMDDETAEDLAEESLPGVDEWNTSDIKTTGQGTDSKVTFTYSNVADVVEEAMPAIVSITNKSVQEVSDWFSRRSYQYESESAGSGFIIGSNDTELLICTNNHVVDGANTLTVTFIDEESYKADVKGTDAGNDLAIIAVSLDSISDETMDKIRVARLGDSDSMRVGEQVVAIGNALGYGQSVTTGIISAKGRSIQVQEGRSILTYEDLIQTDAAINFGNSGGALLNMNGEVIGINSAKATSNSAEGMGYSISVNKALPILEKLMNRKTRTAVDEEDIGYLGITGEGVSHEATYLYGIPEGIYVVSVTDASPAQEAGIAESDIITAFDGEEVVSMDQLRTLLQYYGAGEEVEITLQSAASGAYTEKKVTVTLGRRADYQY